MRVALYQCTPLPLDVSGNLTRLQQQAKVAAAQGAQVLVCPEMFLTGYNIGAHACAELAQAQDGPAATRIAEMAREQGIAILYGYPERSAEQQIYNAVQLIDSHGNRLSNYRKTHLFSDLDKSMFAAGEALGPVVELNGWRVGMLICYDVEFPENTRRLALDGAELILVPTANMAPFDFVCDVTVRARAFENHCYVVYANYCGSEGEIRYCGLSSVCAPDGSRPALAAQDEALLIADLDRAQLTQTRTVNDYFKDRRPGLYSAL
ncbi:carbon-nitrogen hydrolase family protein [Pseudomonas viridiflava]|uniref:carbon-nitrogen hydrolase family protein n=1 Tax=Pseudomonas viridiflava TaxID=33069 RepID=UPI0015E33435|nr:carbon-nitrogen hydrolase family protein [Pseudomonas viridiflava]MBA1231078.1 carbon-nitrogen hydrolase family protein [Pseudomonas viridiflava]